MKLRQPLFNIFNQIFHNKPLVDVSCLIDDIQVPVQECGVEVEDNLGFPILDFWDSECNAHPTNSHCKVYDD